MSITSTQTTTATLDAPQIRELSPGFGVEVQGLQFAPRVKEEKFKLIQDLVTKHGVVVLRKTGLTDETHIALARMFGDLDDVKPYNKAGRANRLKYDELFDVGNMEADGSLVDPKSPRAQANRGNSFFHVDSSFNPRRAGYSLLLSHELPPPGAGGNTEFCDTRRAWDDLDEDFKTELLEKNYVACHSILHSKKLAAPEHFAGFEPADYPMGRHRLVQRHERSGRMNLYLAMHIHHIEGLGAEESTELFEKLFEHATQDKYRVMVEWKDVGDLVIWDNTATMHRAVGGEFAYKYKRDMRRATVHDDSSQAWGLNEHTDLLTIYAREYHPYCPLVPPHLLGPSALERIRTVDFFLLTVMLTIASRDPTQHSVVHRYCWNHAQSLLLQVLLAVPWTQTPRTVEGLLLLSEWLPHIESKHLTSGNPKDVFREGRTTWSVVGQAVRLGYALRLDRAAFRGNGSSTSQDQDQNRLIWMFTYIADRQISVRLGQSFWSRGPSLSSNFTAKDFPTLQSAPDTTFEDYASILQANLELTQILHNAHAILYSSTERTLSMIHEGDYPRYLDDFMESATHWDSRWKVLKASPNLRAALSLLYEYGLYAAVILHKALDADAIKGTTQKEEVASLARRFIAALKEVSSAESHICHGYSDLLEKLWSSKGSKRAAAQHDKISSVMPVADTSPEAAPQEPPHSGGDSVSQSGCEGRMPASSLSDLAALEGGTPDFTSFESYLFGSLWPELASVGHSGEQGGLDQDVQFGFNFDSVL
ncbi:Alpha-ketoglutarate-dependent 2,4-dichlorophenoxyacetate dioxygenase [Colletotrichum viniferum]|nr:Alpha-ketoglutarate-dependent 2,4-dichlorophenoxyacetate dioxygenase [Colletotrichum viniferum]